MSRDLSITALYTSGCWTWAGFAGADLLDHVDSRRVFGATNLVVGPVTRLRGLPSLPHSLVQRHTIIDRVVAETRPAAVLELAAGFSARGLRMSADPALLYVEVDRPAVMARKRGLLERSEAGRLALARPNWRLLEADLAEADLATLAPAGAPLVVVAEGLLMYLDAAAQGRLWQRVRALFADRPGVFVFDLVPGDELPLPGMTGRALEWMMKRFTGGATFTRDLRDRHTLAAELAACGFEVQMLEPKDAPAAWQVPYLDRRTQQLIFTARPSRPTPPPA